MRTATIHFGHALPEEKFQDDGIRARALDHGVTRLRERAGVEIVNILNDACSVVVRGELDVLGRMTADFPIEIDNAEQPAFRGA